MHITSMKRHVSLSSLLPHGQVSPFCVSSGDGSVHMDFGEVLRHEPDTQMTATVIRVTSLRPCTSRDATDSQRLKENNLNFSVCRKQLYKYFCHRSIYIIAYDIQRKSSVNVDVKATGRSDKRGARIGTKRQRPCTGTFFGFPVG